MIPATNSFNTGTDNFPDNHTDNFNFFTKEYVDLETYKKLLNPEQSIESPKPLDRMKIDRENLARLHDSRQKRERHRSLRKGR